MARGENKKAKQKALPLPSPNRSVPAVFNEMDADAFEEMTCALFHIEPGINTSDLYRAKRQKQFGIDVISQRLDGSTEVASCKCYTTIRKGDIPKWANDFLCHWDSHWKHQKVKKFVLVVAAPVHSSQRAVEIGLAKNRFEELGVKFEVWAPRQLNSKIRKDRGLVSQFLGEAYVVRLCGESTPVQISGGIDAGSFTSAVLISQISDLHLLLSDEVNTKVQESLLAEVRKGNLEKVEAIYRRHRHQKHWTVLTAEVQAQLIRLQASVSISKGELEDASKLLDEADQISPQEEPRSRALLLALMVSPDSGLEALGDPISEEGIHLKACLMLAEGRVEEAAATLDEHESKVISAAEQNRIRALIHLSKGQFKEALAKATIAEELEPNWIAVRRTASIVRYACAMSPLSPIECIQAPNPVPIEFLRESEEAENHLRKAYDGFIALTKVVKSAETRAMDETWALACLCNVPRRAIEAAQLCQALLDRDPAHTGAISWARARGIDFDVDRSSTELSKTLIGKSAKIEHLLTLISLKTESGNQEEAKSLFELHCGAFEKQEHKALLERWKQRISGFDLPIALTKLDTENSSPLAPSLQIEQAVHKRNVEFLEEQFQNLATADPLEPMALIVAIELARAGRWKALSAHVGILIKFQSGEALRLAALACFYSGKADQTVQLIDTHAKICWGVGLPKDIQLLQVAALQQAGRTGAALRKAGLLAAGAKTLEDKLPLLHLQLTTGNLRGASPTIRAALRDKALQPQDALKLSLAMSLEDLELARSLWRYAKDKGLPDEMAPEALIAGFRLGIEGEADGFFGTIPNLAATGASRVSLVGLEDIQLQIAETARNIDRSIHLYERGEIPIHLLAFRGNSFLARLLSLPARRSSNVAAPVLLRSGARSAVQTNLQDIRCWNLHMDVTAILVADSLGVLDAIESLPNPIYIPPTLIPTLIQMEGEVAPSQPSMLEAMKVVVDLCKLGQIQPVIPSRSEPETGVTRIGYSVEGNNSIGPEEVVHPSMLPEAFLSCGAIDLTVYSTIVGQFAGGPTGGTSLNLVPGQILQFWDNSILTFAGDGLLRELAQRFRIEVDQDFHEHCKAKIHEAFEATNLAGRLKKIRVRISEGLQIERYAMIPVSQEIESGRDDQIEPGKMDGASSNIEKTLKYSINGSRVDHSIIWIEDRYLSNYLNAGESPIVGSLDVLLGLEQAGLIPTELRYQKLLRLREADVLFLPFYPEEIFHYVSAAPIIDGALVETPALKILRRHFGTTIQASNLLTKRSADRPIDEVPFLIQLRRIVDQCLERIWTAPGTPVEDCKARSTWVWSAFRMDVLPESLLHAPSPETDLFSLASSIVSALSGAIHLVAIPLDPALARLKAYNEWIQETMIKGRFDDSPELMHEVVAQYGNVLTELVKRRDSGSDIQIANQIKLITRVLLNEAPEDIRQALGENKGLSELLGATSQPTLNIDGVAVHPELFWRGVRKALRKGTSRIPTALQAGRITIHRVDSSCVRFEGAVRGGNRDSGFGVLEADQASIDSLLSENHLWTDNLPELLSDASQGLTAHQALAARMQALDAIRNRSVAYFYEQLRIQLLASQQLHIAACTPPLDGSLLRYLRLTPGEQIPWKDRFEQSGRDLIQELGLAEAFRRLASIPVPLSESVLDAFRALPEEELETLLENLVIGAHSPLRRIHLLYLIRATSDQGHRSIHFSETITRLLNEWEESSNLFEELLVWTEHAAKGVGTWRALSTPERTISIWSHADALTNLFLSEGGDPSTLSKAFNSNRRSISIQDALTSSEEGGRSIAEPKTIGGERILYHGLGMILGGEPAESVLPNDQIVRIRECLSIEGQEQHIPAPWLFFDRVGANNELGTFLLANPSGIFEDSVDPSEANLSTVHAAWIENLKDSKDLCSISLLILALMRLTPGSPQFELIQESLREIDLLKLVGSQPEGLTAVRIMADMVAHFGDAEIVEHFRKELIRLARVASQQLSTQPLWFGPSAKNPKLELVPLLVDAAASLAKSPNGTESFGRFGELIAEFGIAWPAKCPLFKQALENIFDAVGPLYCRSLWSPLTRLRAIS